jgi:hypothetical protein
VESKNGVAKHLYHQQVAKYSIPTGKKNPAEEARYDEARPGQGSGTPHSFCGFFPPSIQIQVPPPPTAIPSSFVVSLPLPPPYSSPLLPAPTGVPCGFTSPFVSSVRKSNSSFFSLSLLFRDMVRSVVPWRISSASLSQILVPSFLILRRG